MRAGKLKLSLKVTVPEETSKVCCKIHIIDQTRPSTPYTPITTPHHSFMDGQTSRYNEFCKLIQENAQLLPNESGIKENMAAYLVKTEGLTLQKCIGAGNFGAAYLVQTDTGEEKVLKIQKAHFSTSQESLKGHILFNRDRGDFLHKNYLQHTKSAPETIIYYQNGEGMNQQIGTIMPYVEGKSLVTILEEKSRLPTETAIKLTLDLAKILLEFHKQGIAHRDVKPDNIILTPSGSAVLLDCGITKKYQNHEAGKESPIGSAMYMPAERNLRMRLSGDIGQSDVWSLGVILYQSITGNLPYDNTEEILLALKNGSRAGALTLQQEQSLKEQLSEDGHELAALIIHMLQFKERPSTEEIVVTLSRLSLTSATSPIPSSPGLSLSISTPQLDQALTTYPTPPISPISPTAI